MSAACASAASFAGFALRSRCTGWQVHCGTCPDVQRQARGASHLSAEVHKVTGLSYRTSDVSTAAMASRVPEAVAGERRAGLYDKAWSYFWRPRQGLLLSAEKEGAAELAFTAARGVPIMASVGVAREPPLRKRPFVHALLACSQLDSAR
jgi:hypothetical protein